MSMTLGIIPLGLITLGIMPLGLMPLGLMPLGLMSLGLMPVGPMTLYIMAFSLMPLGLMPLGLIPLGLMPLGLMPLGLMPLGIMTLSLMVLCISVKIWNSPKHKYCAEYHNFRHNVKGFNAECHCAESRCTECRGASTCTILVEKETISKLTRGWAFAIIFYGRNILECPSAIHFHPNLIFADY
jgi:hypothetical protein